MRRSDILNTQAIRKSLLEIYRTTHEVFFIHDLFSKATNNMKRSQNEFNLLSPKIENILNQIASSFQKSTQGYLNQGLEILYDRDSPIANNKLENTREELERITNLLDSVLNRTSILDFDSTHNNILDYVNSVPPQETELRTTDFLNENTPKIKKSMKFSKNDLRALNNKLDALSKSLSGPDPKTTQSILLSLGSIESTLAVPGRDSLSSLTPIIKNLSESIEGQNILLFPFQHRNMHDQILMSKAVQATVPPSEITIEGHSALVEMDMTPRLTKDLFDNYLVKIRNANVSVPGILSQKEAPIILKNEDTEYDDLYKIWELCVQRKPGDRLSKGFLNTGEWAVALHLIEMVKLGFAVPQFPNDNMRAYFKVKRI